MMKPIIIQEKSRPTYGWRIGHCEKLMTESLLPILTRLWMPMPTVHSIGWQWKRWSKLPEPLNHRLNTIRTRKKLMNAIKKLLEKLSMIWRNSEKSSAMIWRQRALIRRTMIFCSCQSLMAMAMSCSTSCSSQRKRTSGQRQQPSMELLQNAYRTALHSKPGLVKCRRYLTRPMW